MSTISSAAIAESLFVMGVAFATIVPRPKRLLSSSSLSSNNNNASAAAAAAAAVGACFGGDLLSRPFRQLMVVLVCMNAFRSFFMTDLRFREHVAQTDESGQTSWMTWAYYLMTTVESFGISFLCLLLAYLLQCRLRVLIYIEPGRDLLIWLFAILTFGIIGTICSVTISPQYWAIKRLGEALSCIPVLQTINLYDKVMTRNHILDSQVTIQTLRVMEMVNLAATVMAAIGYWLGGGISTTPVIASSALTTWQSWSIGFRQWGIFVNWTRAFCHGLLLNMVDESLLRPLVVPMSSTTTSASAADHVNSTHVHHTTNFATTPFEEFGNSTSSSNLLQVSLISKSSY